MSKKDKEIGMPTSASTKAKKIDEVVDKKHNIKEGSKADLKVDKKIATDDKKGKLKKTTEY